MDTLIGIVMLAVVLVFVGIALDAARRAKYRLLTPRPLGRAGSVVLLSPSPGTSL